MMGGWIKIYQTIREHWIWNDPRKLKWWIDLLMLAEWRDSKRLVGSDLVTIKRGQLIASVHYLRERWAYKDDNGVQRKPSRAYHPQISISPRSRSDDKPRETPCHPCNDDYNS